MLQTESIAADIRNLGPGERCERYVPKWMRYSIQHYAHQDGVNSLSYNAKGALEKTHYLMRFCRPGDEL